MKLSLFVSVFAAALAVGALPTGGDDPKPDSRDCTTKDGKHGKATCCKGLIGLLTCLLTDACEDGDSYCCEYDDQKGLIIINTCGPLIDL